MEKRDSALRLFDVSGNESRNFVIAESLKLGSLTASRQPLMVSPGGDSLDGILATDLMLRYDVDIDFRANSLKYFSPDHCPGKVVYWAPPAVAAVPITIKDKFHIMVSVKLDGHDFNALLDTGATRTTMSRDVAKRVFGLEPESPGMTKLGIVNDDPKLVSYGYQFKTLSFNGVDVNNLRTSIIPDRMNSGSRETQTESRARSVMADFKLPELILGMDVLRHLHVYMAFKEKTLYVSAGSEPPKQEDFLAWLDHALTLSPNNAWLLNNRCFVRGLKKTFLEEALQDCASALKIRPQASHIMDSKAFVLYQLGRHQEAMETYNQVLAIDPQSAASLFMRGHTRKSLGDAAGGNTDIAAAKTIDADVFSTFEGSGVSAN
jgi:predicted aspartyl protease